MSHRTLFRSCVTVKIVLRGTLNRIDPVLQRLFYEGFINLVFFCLSIFFCNNVARLLGITCPEGGVIVQQPCKTELSKSKR